MKALLLVDMQRDFMPGGALAVPGADGLIPRINEAMPQFPLVIASFDCHPPHHSSFQPQGGPWPVHCVENTPGADLAPGLNAALIKERVYKGKDPLTDNYSPCFNQGILSSITELYVAGVALEYCVLHTCLEARRLGLKVTLLRSLCAALTPEGEAAALQQLAAAGVILA